MFNNINLVSILIGVAVAMIIFNLIAMVKAYYKRSVARKKLAEAKERMADIDKELKEKKKQLEDVLKKFKK